MDPSVRTGQLPNGITYYVRSNAYPKGQLAAGFFVRAGSLQEDEDQLGLAHVVEHMLFNDTRHFPHRRLIEWLRSVGVELGPHANAFTSFAHTDYTIFAAPTANPAVVDSLVMALADMAFRATFDSTELENERSVVLEEWRLGLGAMERLWRRFHNRALYGTSRYAERDPIGTDTSLRSFSREAVVRFYREWYRPELIAVALVGDLPVDTLEALVRRHFAHIPPRQGRPAELYPIPEHPGFRISVGSDPELRYPNVRFIRRLPALTGQTKLDYRTYLLRTLAASIIEERLDAYTYTADAPAPYVQCSYEAFVPGYDAIVATMLSLRSGKALEAVEIIAYELAKARRLGLSASELERHKAKLRRSLQEAVAERDKTDSGYLLFRFRDHFIYHRPLMSPEQELELALRFLPTIQPGEVQRAMEELLGEDNWVVLLSLREQSGEVVPTPDEVRQAIERGHQRAARAQLHHEELPPLLDVPPTPGRIVRQRRLAEIDAVEWQLSNGARVVVKPTTLKNDQIWFWAVSPGGHSLAADSLFVSARQAAALVGEQCGAGTLNPFNLTKVLAGRKVRLSPFLTETTEGLSGEAGPEDIEPFMQLLYLYLARPRLDSTCIAAYRSTQQSILQGRHASPDELFLDTLMTLYWRGHPRKRPLNAEDVEQLQPQQAYAFYRERFGNVGDWVFLFVGAVNTKTLRPLVERYIGSLPGTPRRERPRTVAAEPLPSGADVRVVFHKGTEPKSWVGIVYGGPFRWSVENRFRLEAAERLLAMCLENRLREELGGTYFIGVSTRPTAEPRPWYTAQLLFSCDPERADTLEAALFAEIERLKSRGPTEDELFKLQRVLVHDFQLEQQRNIFWTELLQYYYLYGDPLRQMLHFPEWVQNLTPEALRAAIREFFPAPALRVRMMPEAGAAK
jgi:zinc protease